VAKPLVALVGRPNVGKSTLFNRLVGERRAIVFDEPGTTRDRTYGETDWNGRDFDLVDTGGLQSEAEIARASSGEIARGTRQQAQLAIEEADAIVFLVDSRSGLLPADEEVADLLRRSDKPVLLAVNKAESATHRENAVEFYTLGIGEPIPVSAYHGSGTGDLLDAIVADVPGTTRDPLDTRFAWEGHQFTLIDTAGIRRRGRIEHGAVEQYSVIRSMKAIGRCDVALLVIDAVEGFTAQDLHIAGFVQEEGKGIVVAVNKWDAIEKDDRTMDEYRRAAAEALAFMPYAPLVFISALTGQRVGTIPEALLEVIAEREKRAPTGRLNQVIRAAFLEHPPATRRHEHLRFYYATQPRVGPPTFVFFVNNPKLVHFGYRRYLENRLREEFGFTGTPIRLSFRGRDEK
jgi:GTP-binding protein